MRTTYFEMSWQILYSMSSVIRAPISVVFKLLYLKIPEIWIFYSLVYINSILNYFCAMNLKVVFKAILQYLIYLKIIDAVCTIFSHAQYTW